MNGRVTGQGIWRIKVLGFTREWGLTIALTSLALLWLTLVAAAWAEAAEDADKAVDKAVDKSDDEYNFNWLDTDKKIYVLQNRKFLKGGHALISAMAGVGFSNPYRTTYNVDPRFTFFLSESWGLEVFYNLTSNSPNSTFQALTNASGTTSALPQVREIRGQYGLLLQYIPWYAKINVFNSILHFDWYFSGGAGQIQSFVDTRPNKTAASNYVQQDILGIFFSTGHYYHLSQRFDVRIDVTGAFYQAPINGLTGESSWYSNYNFGIGVGLKL